MVVFTLTLVSVIVTNYAILTNEKNLYRLAKASNGTIFFSHISQTAAPDSKVGIHNPAPEAIFEVTTHANIKNSMRLSRMLAVGAADSAGKTAYFEQYFSASAFATRLGPLALVACRHSLLNSERASQVCVES